MKHNLIISFFILFSISKTEQIDGRWIPSGFSNTMYEFIDSEPFAEAGLRYTYYCPNDNGCDASYWDSVDISNAIPNPNPYWVNGNNLVIDLFFGNEATYDIEFRCDGEVVDFYYDEDDFGDGLHSTMYKLGFDDFNNDCLDTNPDYCLCTEEWDPVCGVDGNTYSNACFAECEYVVIAYDGECLELNEEIEGRWHVVLWEQAIMYQFVDTEAYADAGLMYTIYVDENGEFHDIGGDNVGGTPKPYIVQGDFITIDYHFGNVVTYQMIYKCNRQVLELYSPDYGMVTNILFREFFDYNECNEINECYGLNESDCEEIEGCEWEANDNTPWSGACVEQDVTGCDDLNQTECENTEGCEWEGSDNTPGGGICIESSIIDCNDYINENICESFGCTWSESDNLPNGGACFDGLIGDVNLDDNRNVLDIIIIVNFIIGITEPSISEFQTSDINFDEQLNVLDIVSLVSLILDPS